jgi:hypothetical protein
MNESSSSQTEEETTDRLCAGAVGTPATLASSAPTDRKKKEQYVYKLLGTSSLKEGAMRHMCRNSITREDVRC